jgi:RNA polymerase sigma factor (sigma-70 family)
MPKIRKTAEGKDVSERGAFPCGTKLELTVECPRILGSSAVVLRIAKDMEGDRDIPFEYADTENGVDVYRLVLDTAELCGAEENGLFYYELLFLRGADTLFTDTFNYVDFSLERSSGGRFMLLIHKPEYKTPDWFKGRVMYHIFVDRFCKGEGEVGQRDDAILNTDWDGGELLLSDVLGSDEPPVGQEVEEAEERLALRRAVARLSERERLIIELRFGLGGRRELTQSEVAELLGISQSYISRLEKKILRKLRADLAGL